MEERNNTVAIKFEHVSKQYILGAIGGTTLRDDVSRLIAKIRRKEDPTSIIGKELAPSKMGVAI